MRIDHSQTSSSVSLSLKRVIQRTLFILIAAIAASWLLPNQWSSFAVASVFLGATWWWVWRKPNENAFDWGVSFGGLLSSPPAPWNVVFRSTLQALGWALLIAAIVFPPFVMGFSLYWNVSKIKWAIPPKMFDSIAGQLVLVALPEEVFFRGILQSSLDRIWKPHVRLFGANIGIGLLVSSVVFTLGHYATIPVAARLAVFFPSLAFGWLRARTHGVGASIVFHALSNLLTEMLWFMLY